MNMHVLRNYSLPQIQRKIIKAPIGEYIYFILITHIYTSNCIYNCNKHGDDFEATLVIQGDKRQGRKLKGGPILWLASKVTL